jgi:UrcA family protein
MLTFTVLLAAATMTPLAPAPSGAQRAVVHAGDLDLRSTRGARALRWRVDQAVVALSAGEATPIGTIIPPHDLQVARAEARQAADRLIKAVREGDGN